MAERVAAYPKVCSLNPARDPMVSASKIQPQHVSKNDHEISGTINWFPRWLATIKWYLFISEPPSIRLRGIPPQDAIQMDEDASKTLEINKSSSWNLIVDKINCTLRVDNMVTQHHEKNSRTQILMAPTSGQPLNSELST